jgi:DNA-binding NarL/FixJ family response regulator
MTGAAPVTTRILLVDDHPVIRRVVRELLEHQPDLLVCGEAATVKEAVDAASALRPDLVIVDMSLRGVGGVELVRRLVQLEARPLVVVFSMYDEPAFAELAFMAGARGYVSKQEDPDALVRAIREVLAGRTYLGDMRT